MDISFKPFATPKQWEYCQAYIDSGENYREASRRTGIHNTTILRAVKAVKAKAAAQGHAPGSDLNHSVPPGFVLDGVSDMRTNAEGKPQWLKYRRDKDQDDSDIEAMLEALREECPKASPVPAEGQYASNLMAGYPVGDHHFGMLAWGEEVGADYDLKIAEQLLIDSMCHLVKVGPKCDTALIALLGDFRHYDSMESVTPTNKHLLDADSRPQKMIRAAMHTIRAMINVALEHHNNVHVIFETGNHDPLTACIDREVWSMFYEDDPRVTIDTQPGNFHYFEFGKNLIGTHHGDRRIKPDQMPGLMATDKPEEWGRTRHRAWWTGHVHHDNRKSFNGADWESFKILPPGDAHAYWSGYRSKRGGQSIIFDRELGEVARHTVTPEMLR